MGSFIESILQNTITFLAITDPIGAGAVILSLLGKNVTKEKINEIAYKSILTSIIAFFVVLIGGNFVLNMFEIDIYSIKVMGGIILIMMAIQMIQGKKIDPDIESKSDIDMMIVPISIPIIFGPAIFSTIIILKEHSQSFADILSIVYAFLINAIIMYFVLKNSIYIKRYLGKTGQSVITKIMGLIVGAIAVQFIIGGSISLINNYLN